MRIHHECQQLCSNSLNSKFKLATPENLQSFSWRALADDLKHNAPLLFAVLQTVGAPHRPRNIRKGVSEESRFPALCTAAAILLKERCERIDAVQQLIGLILFNGNASKQVILMFILWVKCSSNIKFILLKLYFSIKLLFSLINHYFYRHTDVCLTFNSLFRQQPPLQNGSVLS